MGTDTRARLRAYLSSVPRIIIAGAFAAIPLSWVFASLATWPDAWIIPFDRLINAFFDVLSSPILFGISIQTIFRWTVPPLNAPISLLQTMLPTGVSLGYGDQAVQILPPLSWAGVSAATTVASYQARGLGLAVLAGVTCAFLLLFGLWDSMMVTLSQMIVAVPLGVALGFIGGFILSASITPSDHPVPARSGADNSYFLLSRASHHILRTWRRARDHCNHHIWSASDGAQHGARIGGSGSTRRRAWSVARLQLLAILMESPGSHSVAETAARRQSGRDAVLFDGHSRGPDRLGRHRNDVLLALQRLALGAGLVAGAGITLMPSSSIGTFRL